MKLSTVLYKKNAVLTVVNGSVVTSWTVTSAEQGKALVEQLREAADDLNYLIELMKVTSEK